MDQRAYIRRENNSQFIVVETFYVYSFIYLFLHVFVYFLHLNVDSYIDFRVHLFNSLFHFCV